MYSKVITCYNGSYIGSSDGSNMNTKRMRTVLNKVQQKRGAVLYS